MAPLKWTAGWASSDPFSTRLDLISRPKECSDGSARRRFLLAAGSRGGVGNFLSRGGGSNPTIVAFEVFFQATRKYIPYIPSAKAYRESSLGARGQSNGLMLNKEHIPIAQFSVL